MHEGENNPSNAYKILGLVELTDYPPFTLNMSRVDRFLQIPQVEILSPPLAAWFPGGATIFQIGSDGRLTLSGWLLNQLDLSGFAWRTKNSLWMN